MSTVFPPIPSVFQSIELKGCVYLVITPSVTLFPSIDKLRCPNFSPQRNDKRSVQNYVFGGQPPELQNSRPDNLIYKTMNYFKPL